MLRLTNLSRPFPVTYRHSVASPNSPAKFVFRAMATQVPQTNLQTSPGAADIEILDSLAALRNWRQRARDLNHTVGFVPTMGALHDGHLDLVFGKLWSRHKLITCFPKWLDATPKKGIRTANGSKIGKFRTDQIRLVRESLRANPLTVVSIFVNPSQFAPHEDLATYPKSLDSDLTKLREVSVDVNESGTFKEGDVPSSSVRKPSAVFIPPVKDMYPSGITTNVAEQRGAFVQVKGLEEQMEGKSRPGFFRGVATVVLKLFNAVEPTNAYFGQKDIQQALLLRRLASDLLLSHPSSQNIHIVPTHRDPTSGLALSSRNMYLNEKERAWAPTLWRALQVGKQRWESELSKETGRIQGINEKVIGAAADVIKAATIQAEKEGVAARLDYVQLNWADTLEPVEDIRPSIGSSGEPDSVEERAVILSGAMWVGKTRLIDNVILGREGVTSQIIS